jgi:hypothetical protein
MPSWYLVCALADAPACAGLLPSDPIASAASATAAETSAARMIAVIIEIFLLANQKSFA